jgi:hypothetical protein
MSCSARNGWKDSLKACISPVSKPRHINSVFTVNTPILYIYSNTSSQNVMFYYKNIDKNIMSYYNMKVRTLWFITIPLVRISCSFNNIGKDGISITIPLVRLTYCITMSLIRISFFITISSRVQNVMFCCNTIGRGILYVWFFLLLPNLFYV